jgi:hypothetical protein
MAGTTSPYGFPYPTAGDTFADPAGDIQALAEAFDTQMQSLVDSAADASKPPAVFVSGGTQQTNGTFNAMALNNVRFDSTGMASGLGSNAYELITREAGVYFILGTVAFPTSGAGTLFDGACLFVNGVQPTGAALFSVEPAATAVGGWIGQISILRSLSVGDRIAVGARVKASPTDPVTATVSSCALAAVRIST